MTSSKKVRLTLRGTVATRPRTLNAVGTTVRANRSFPVTLEGRRIGSTLTEQYPDVRTNDVVFEVEVDSDAIQEGSRLEIASVRQSNSWPGPAPVEILVHLVAKGALS
jgi:hypothetical protein